MSSTCIGKFLYLVVILWLEVSDFYFLSKYIFLLSNITEAVSSTGFFFGDVLSAFSFKIRFQLLGFPFC